ncbi:MAG: hypothetical protein O7D98_00780 [Candidatus Dadabacteria bacterium]|nr:hypothetical protein [Candidatus Dadabacteria bacterium]
MADPGPNENPPPEGIARLGNYPDVVFGISATAFFLVVFVLVHNNFEGGIVTVLLLLSIIFILLI